MLANVFGDDDVAFEVDWGPYGFAGVTRSYPGFWAAADEMADSRVYGGIHFRFDNEAGQEVGANVANHVLDHFLLEEDDVDSAAGAAGTIIGGALEVGRANVAVPFAVGTDSAITPDDELSALLA